MSIASEITRLQGVKSDILTAIADKGVTVPAGSALDDCPGLIADIPAGSNYKVIGGKEYKTVIMPDGKEWLAQNLDFKFCTVGGTLGVSAPNAWYYNNDESTYGWNGYKCGLLYNWYACKLLNDNRSDLCPGWHVPTEAEWNTLISAVNSNSAYKLKAKDNSVVSGFPSGWQGADEYDFTVLPGGYIYGNFYYVGSQTAYFTLTENALNPSTAVIKLFTTGSDVTSNKYDKSYGFYLRLVSDA